MRLDHLDRLVGEVAARIWNPVFAVTRAKRTAGAGKRLGADERPPIVPPGDDRERDAALASGRNPVGQDLGKRTKQYVEHAPAHQGASGASCRRAWIEDSSF